MYNVENACGSSKSPKIFHTSKDPPLFFIMMRFNIKVALLLVTILGIVTIFSLWSMCGNHSFKEFKEIHREIGSEEIDCIINNDLVIGCKKEGGEVFLPFSFIKKYFEVYGKLVTYDGIERFEWSHNSYNKIYFPKGKYDPRGVFMYFENYNVEMRDRVKCISAIEGVPISTQWESKGYFYATQIAQFGLSHYSKNLTDPEPRRKIIENCEKEQANWFVPPNSRLERVTDNFTSILKFRTGDHISDSVLLKMDHVLDFVMNVDIFLEGNSSLMVILQNREKGEIFNMHYISSNISITAQDNNIYHGIGSIKQWRTLNRDLIVDLDKGLNYLLKDKTKHKRLPRSKFKITAITLFGQGAIDNLTLSSSEHMRLFYNAAEWFVKYQNPKTGGWAIPAKRHLASGFNDLKPGWYSAMSQGHAISLLARAYHHSGGEDRYLKAAVLGLKPFTVPSQAGGVMTTFLDKYRWYEEYPTQPSSFVLNGFIYSLLGLYDLMMIAPSGSSGDAEYLFWEGVKSLRAMITLFDMGSGTSYDLRHFTLSIAPNLARWDYHATHINQLLLLSKIVEEPLFGITAERWIAYMNGKRAPHN